MFAVTVKKPERSYVFYTKTKKSKESNGKEEEEEESEKTTKPNPRKCCRRRARTFENGLLAMMRDGLVGGDEVCRSP
ncbi:hypothetical protein Csa_011879 [Cucumis sativus]|uniref:Uncharacterized protein n=1 Tax=Cucumis sativus TaxID=3659 RepID=A0A0A0K325_CUCSA|nr:hypothetical protein Csa_011879 [Cucumis sativus]